MDKMKKAIDEEQLDKVTGGYDPVLTAVPGKCPKSPLGNHEFVVDKECPIRLVCSLCGATKARQR